MNIPFLSLKDVTALHGAEINEAVSRVVNGGWYLQGKENEQFEKHYSDFIGTKYTIGCANGLDALIWIFRAYIEMGVMKPGDEVIVPANTYIATILSITASLFIPPPLDAGIIHYKSTVVHMRQTRQGIFVPPCLSPPSHFMCHGYSSGGRCVSFFFFLLQMQ